MKNYIRIIFNAISCVCIIGLCFALKTTNSFISSFFSYDPNISYLKELYMQAVVCYFAIVVVLVLNVLMWLSPMLFGVPLTPEQIAERKRIKAEHKKAKLQEKINKLNN